MALAPQSAPVSAQLEEVHGPGTQTGKLGNTLRSVKSSLQELLLHTELAYPHLHLPEGGRPEHSSSSAHVLRRSHSSNSMPGRHNQVCTVSFKWLTLLG